MKKIFFFTSIFALFFSLNLFPNSITFAKPDSEENKIESADTLQNNLSFLTKICDLENYADKETNQSLDLEKIDNALKYTHASFAGITYASLWALDAIGLPLLYLAFNNPNYQYYDDLKWAHIGIAISALTTFATTITIAFTKLGIKLKNGFAIRKTHLAAAIVTLSFYVIELPTIILSAVYFANKLDGAKWVGLAHGITCAATTVAFSVSFITIFF